MPSSTYNLSVDEQQATVGAATAAKRKEDDATVAAQDVVATAHREQEAFVAVVAAARKTLDEARAHKHAAALAWEKEKIIARHMEQQLATTQGIVIIQDNNEDRFIDAGSNPNAALTAHMHLQNIRSVVTIVLEPSSPDYERWCDLMLLMLHYTPSMTTSSRTSSIRLFIGLDWIASW
jgi:hypothetical protein